MKNIRILGMVASAVVLGVLVWNSEHFFYLPNMSPQFDLLLYLVCAVLPSFMLAFLMAFRRFWWSFGFGLWFIFLSLVSLWDFDENIPESLTLFLAALTVSTIPFLARHAKINDKDSHQGFADPPAVRSVIRVNARGLLRLGIVLTVIWEVGCLVCVLHAAVTAEAYSVKDFVINVLGDQILKPFAVWGIVFPVICWVAVWGGMHVAQWVGSHVGRWISKISLWIVEGFRNE